MIPYIDIPEPSPDTVCPVCGHIPDAWYLVQGEWVCERCLVRHVMSCVEADDPDDTAKRYGIEIKEA